MEYISVNGLKDIVSNNTKVIMIIDFEQTGEKEGTENGVNKRRDWFSKYKVNQR